MEANQSKLVRFYAHPWTQILLISMICFCLPGVSCSTQHEARSRSRLRRAAGNLQQRRTNPS